MRAVQLWRYPVKSLGGEPLQSVRFDVGGVEFDRRVAVNDSDPRREGKALTGRRQHLLLGFCARVKDGDVFVRTPAGIEYRVDDERWIRDLEHVIGQPASLRASAAPIHDDSDILVLNAATLRVLSAHYGSFVNPIRFRPNVIVDGPESEPFAELAWPGSEFSLGDAVLQASHPCSRCVLTTVDPETLVSDPSFLKLVVQHYAGRFGVYCKVVKPGEVRIGDEWRLQGAVEVRVS